MTQEFLCGGTGKLTPEARAELDDFAAHLKHKQEGAVSDCRFCAATVGGHAFIVNPGYVDRSNPSKLSERLYLAGAATAREHEKLRELGITAVVNLTPDDFGCAEAGFKMLCVRIDDAEPLPPRYVEGFLRVMDEWEASGEVVLIHCHAGISRTSSFAIAWLMHKRGANAQSDLRTMWSTAEDDVGAVRPIIMPHYKLKAGVLEYFATR